MSNDLKMLHYADLEVLGLGVRSTIWRMINLNQFPAPVRIGVNRVAWPESQIREWLKARKNEKCRTPNRGRQEQEARQ